MMQWLAVFIGGGLGSLARYGVSVWMMGRYAHALPLATIISNLFASVLLGIGFYMSEKSMLSSEWKLFLMVGVCGGFSTFSTFSLETFMLIKEGMWTWAIANVLLSVSICIAAIWFILR